MDNEEYATTGGQETPTAHGADLDAAARAMGVARTATVRTDGRAEARSSATAGGPWVIVAKVAESAPTAKPPLDCVFIKQRFMAAIGTTRSRPPSASRCRSRNHDARRVRRDAPTPPAAARAARRARVARHGRRDAGRRDPARRAHRPARRRGRTAAGRAACSARRSRQRRRNAALANGTAAHALDYDDMCFVSLAHPSAPLVVGRARGGRSRRARPARALLDAYVVGFEIEGRLGRGDEPAALSARLALHVDARHDRRRRGGVAAARARRGRAGHALAIAASEASGLKENFGTMVKPLHAGLAARNGVAGGAAGEGRDDRERGGDRRPAGISRGDGQRAARRSTTSSADLGDALGDPRHRDHRQAVSVVRRHASRRSTRCSI